MTISLVFVKDVWITKISQNVHNTKCVGLFICILPTYLSIYLSPCAKWHSPYTIQLRSYISRGCRSKVLCAGWVEHDFHSRARLVKLRESYWRKMLDRLWHLNDPLVSFWSEFLWVVLEKSNPFWPENWGRKSVVAVLSWEMLVWPMQRISWARLGFLSLGQGFHQFLWMRKVTWALTTHRNPSCSSLHGLKSIWAWNKSFILST